MANKDHSMGLKRPSRRGSTGDICTVEAIEPRLMMSAAASPLSAIPQLASRSSASAKLYLDFDGDTTASWLSYRPGTTPAYDQDGSPTTFSDGELDSIRNIWARIAEKYSPFNLDVTTINPGNLNNGQTLRIVFGGAGAWLGGLAGGVNGVGSFYNSEPNTGFVFTKNLSNGSPKVTAEAGAHEAGHGFGLDHQGLWSGSTLVQEYNPGNSQTAPIMGNSYSAARGLWWRGPTSESPTTIEDELAVLSNLSNGFGYRADDYGNGIGNATGLSFTGATASAAGVIEKASDADYFSFTTGGGNVSFTAATASLGAMLDLKLELRSSSGALISTADTSSLGETLSANLAAGSYFIDVASHGSYGDIGQYTLTGTVSAATPTPTPTPTPTAPSNLSARAISATQIDLAWTDNSSDETGFKIQRSTDGGSTWSTMATVSANVTSYHDTALAAGTTASYRMYAYTSGAVSALSNTATAQTPAAATALAAPSDLFAQTLSSRSIALTWKDNSTNETGFKVEQSTDGRTWTQIGTVGANATSATVSGLRSSTLYYYRIRAYNASANSAYSNVDFDLTDSGFGFAARSLPTAKFSATPITSDSDDLARHDRSAGGRLFDDPGSVLRRE